MRTNTHTSHAYTVLQFSAQVMIRLKEILGNDVNIDMLVLCEANGFLGNFGLYSLCLTGIALRIGVDFG